MSSTGEDEPQPKRRHGLESISCKCNLKCSTFINHLVIDQIWDNFYSLENKNIQKNYLQTLIEVKVIQRRHKTKHRKRTKP